MRVYISASFCITIFAICVFVGCSNTTETKPSTDATSKSDTHSDESSNGSDNQESVGGTDQATSDDSAAVSIPDDFPNDIHIADGAKSAEFVQAGGKDNLVLMYAESDEQQFIKSYLDAMVSQGWTQVTSSKLPIGTITNFKKDDRKVTVSISPPKDKMIKVALVLSKK